MWNPMYQQYPMSMPTMYATFPPVPSPPTSPNYHMGSPMASPMKSLGDQPLSNPNCAGNDVGACNSLCFSCSGTCKGKCMACVGGCYGKERQGYIFETALCEGRYGFVRLGHNKEGREVALKVIPHEKFTQSEVELQNMLPNHPHIVKLYEAFRIDHLVILVQEYAKAGDLFEYMQKKREASGGGALPEKEARSLFLQMLSPVRDLHFHNVAHQDVKLENYLLTEASADKVHLKLSDFGAAEVLTDGTSHCRKGHISPEKKVFMETGIPYNGFKSDIYQLGSALHELAFGMREPRPDGSLNPPQGCKPSPDMVSLLQGMLSPNPNHRITMSQVVAHPWIAGALGDSKPEEVYKHDTNSITPNGGPATVTSIPLQGSTLTKNDIITHHSTSPSSTVTTNISNGYPSSTYGYKTLVQSNSPNQITYYSPVHSPTNGLSSQTVTNAQIKELSPRYVTSNGSNYAPTTHSHHLSYYPSNSTMMMMGNSTNSPHHIDQRVQMQAPTYYIHSNGAPSMIPDPSTAAMYRHWY